jgi:probable rRNA maturation factor
MIEIINRQSRYKIDVKALADFTEISLRALAPSKSATIVFVSDATIRKLNQQFRGKNYATDVLSFPTKAEKFETTNQGQLGEIVISAPRAAVQAVENELTFENELQQLILHGLLHLCGYDHESDKGEMNRLELKLRRKLGI